MPLTRIGDFAVSRIADFEGPSFDPVEFFPDWDVEVLREHAELLGPRGAVIESSPEAGQAESVGRPNTATASSEKPVT